MFKPATALALRRPEKAFNIDLLQSIGLKPVCLVSGNNSFLCSNYAQPAVWLALQTAVLKSSNVERTFLNLAYAHSNLTCSICEWPRPSRDEVDANQLDSMFARNKVQPIC